MSGALSPCSALIVPPRCRLCPPLPKFPPPTMLRACWPVFDSSFDVFHGAVSFTFGHIWASSQIDRRPRRSSTAARLEQRPQQLMQRARREFRARGSVRPSWGIDGTTQIAQTHTCIRNSHPVRPHGCCGCVFKSSLSDRCPLAATAPVAIISRR